MDAARICKTSLPPGCQDLDQVDAQVNSLNVSQDGDIVMLIH